MDLNVFLQDISQAALRAERTRKENPTAASEKATAARSFHFTRETLSRRTVAVTHVAAKKL
jgi:hypothetical protein